MLEIKTAKEAGFGDAPRWLIYKEGNPIIQLHLYDEFYTLFWRGNASVGKLRSCLNHAVAECKQKLSLDPQNLAWGNGLAFAAHSKFDKVPFVLHPHSKEEREINKAYRKAVYDLGSEVCFIRWDMEDGPFPLILWGGTIKDPSEEIGFSSRRIIPKAILDLFRSSSATRVTTNECQKIAKMLADKLPSV